MSTNLSTFLSDCRNWLRIQCILGKIYEENGKKKNQLAEIFPYFVLGFIAFGVIRTTGDYFFVDINYWKIFIKLTKYVAEFLLITSMSAIGYNTALRNFKELGLKPFTIGLVAALIVSFSSAGIIIISNYIII